MSVDKSLVALLSNFTEFMVFLVKFHFDDYVNVHKYCLLQNLRLLIVHSFSAPSLAVSGRVGCKFTPTVVRRGQTDWFRRLLCGNLGGYIAGLENYSPAPHSSRARRAPHRA